MKYVIICFGRIFQLIIYFINALSSNVKYGLIPFMKLCNVLASTQHKIKFFIFIKSLIINQFLVISISFKNYPRISFVIEKNNYESITFASVEKITPSLYYC